MTMHPHGSGCACSTKSKWRPVGGQTMMVSQSSFDAVGLRWPSDPGAGPPLGGRFRCHRGAERNDMTLAIQTQYRPATTTRESSIAATSGGRKARIPYPHALTGGACHLAAVHEWCDRHGFGPWVLVGAAPAPTDAYGWVFLIAPFPAPMEGGAS